MERVLKGTGATIQATFYVDGTASDPSPDSATISIVRADGTTLVSSTAATNSGTGVFTFVLTPTHTAQLDRLTARWTASFSGQDQTLETHIEVVGGFLFSIADAKADSALGSLTSAQIATERTRAEESLERACGVAFVPRYARETLSGEAEADLVLRQPLLRTVRAATVDGTALTSTELAEIGATSIGAYWPNGWTRGVSNVVVDYEHGYDYPPSEVSRAALRLAKHYLVPSTFDDRVTRAQAGSEMLEFASPVSGNFGIPEVDAIVSRYGYVLGVA